MSVNEIISSGLLESYVLGTASADETAMVRELCLKYPELLKEIESIEEALINYASKNTAPLNSALKETLQSTLFNDQANQGGKVIPIQAPGPSLKAYKFGIAASVLLLLGSSAYIFNLHQKLDKLNLEILALNASRNVMADELKVQRASFTDINNKFNIVSNPKVKTIALNGMNSLTGKGALVHWNPETSELYFNAPSLPSPTNKQYQLWAIVDGKPVDAGVIDLQNSAAFQKMKQIRGAQAFAVTIETIGGSASPSLDTMCLLGNV